MSDYRTMFVSPWLQQLFTRVLRARHVVVGVFALLTLAGLYGALQIPTDTSIDRLIVPSDPVAQATREFERAFPEGEEALIVLEAPDPLSPAALQGADQLERELDAIPKIEAHSLVNLYFRSGAPAGIDAGEAAKLRAFAAATSLVRRVGLMGDHYPAIALDLRVNSPAERDQVLSAIDAKVLPLSTSGHPFTAVRRVGSPWLDAWLERQTGESTKKFMPLFGIFLLTLVFILYRSWRALPARIFTPRSLGAVGAGAGVGLCD